MAGVYQHCLCHLSSSIFVILENYLSYYDFTLPSSQCPFLYFQEEGERVPICFRVFFLLNSDLYY